jgi:hypothetical protein
VQQKCAQVHHHADGEEGDSEGRGQTEKPAGEGYAAASEECFRKPFQAWGLLAITVGPNPVTRPLTAGRVIVVG